jgi:DNA-binding NtrC family response regulator
MKTELENLIDQMYSSGILYSEAVREFQKRFILRVLKERRGNKCKAGRELGMHRNTLTRTIAALGMREQVSQVNGHCGRKDYSPRRKPNRTAAMAAAAGEQRA